MKKLLESDLEEKYIQYILGNNLISEELKTYFIKLLTVQDLSIRLQLWNDLKIKLADFKQIKQLANPYYIGFGNPDSDILFIGKEKAFNIMQSPELLLHESINNILQWKVITKNESKSTENLLHVEKNNNELIFNPKVPQLYHSGKIKGRTTWGMYREIVSQIKLVQEDIVGKDSDHNFFNDCFMTELNFKPSNYSEGHGLNNNRRAFLKNPFFKSFRYVIVGANAIIGEEALIEIFDCDATFTKINLEENRMGKKSKSISILTSNTQKIILCNQLSGAAGWTTEAIKDLVKNITEDN
ncbi:hypothetical protein [Flavobacterium sp. 14A]|uniref:hypothetical protein n=1 Tax=Flavobacterium sp. 14A TaxID=2735896 RepID=UPI00156E8F04|nr:hypothetical protein [Flavobacterium sp. 14A]NRT10470.1 hypothetical protein [Flavobacterium sp. 14A]